MIFIFLSTHNFLIDYVQIVHFCEQTLCIGFFHRVAYLTWLHSGVSPAKSEQTNQHRFKSTHPLFSLESYL